MKLLQSAIFLAFTLIASAESKSLDLEALKIDPAVAREGAVLTLEAPDDGSKKTHPILEIENPGITQESYAVSGEVRYSGMADGSYLENWNHLPAKAGDKEIAQSFFSRTLGESGPMGKLSGDSDWRDFQLPGIVNDGSGRVPLKLSMNVHFADGTGKVELRNLKVIDGLGPIGGPAVQWSRNLVLVNILIGIVVLIGLGWWQLVRRKRKEELRRIQAADVR